MPVHGRKLKQPIDEVHSTIAELVIVKHPLDPQPIDAVVGLPRLEPLALGQQLVKVSVAAKPLGWMRMAKIVAHQRRQLGQVSLVWQAPLHQRGQRVDQGRGRVAPDRIGQGIQVSIRHTTL